MQYALEGKNPLNKRYMYCPNQCFSMQRKITDFEVETESATLHDGDIHRLEIESSVQIGNRAQQKTIVVEFSRLLQQGSELYWTTLHTESGPVKWYHTAALQKTISHIGRNYDGIVVTGYPSFDTEYWYDET
jgi:hypothetical protein